MPGGYLGPGCGGESTMLARYAIAPALLFALQIAPAAVTRDSNGRFRLALGGQLGEYENQEIGCSGDVLARQRVSYHTVGGEAEAWITPTLRVMGYAGNMTATGTSGPDVDVPYEGTFGGGLIALEGRKLGIGLGVSVAPDGDLPGSSSTHPMPYLRFGALDRVHLRLEVNGAGTPGGPPEIVQLSVARGFGAERRVAWRLGVGAAAFPTAGDNNLDLSLEGAFPVNRFLDLGLAGALRAPDALNGGVFGRLHFGRVKPR